MKPLTECQERILTTIQQLTIDLQCPPTLRELAGALGWSSYGSVAIELHKIRQAGRVTWKFKKQRTLKVVEQE